MVVEPRKALIINVNYTQSGRGVAFLKGSAVVGINTRVGATK